MMEDNTSLILFPGEHGFNDEQSTKEEVREHSLIPTLSLMVSDHGAGRPWSAEESHLFSIEKTG